MKEKVINISLKCKLCEKIIKKSKSDYQKNAFCNECIENRLEKAGAIKLSSNYRVIDLGYGYIEIISIKK